MYRTTKDRMAIEIYDLRAGFGENDPFRCHETGEKWNNDKHNNVVALCLVIKRLAKKHHRLAEMDCNGEGWVRGQRYYGGQIDDYAKKEYGYSVKSAYPDDSEVSVFDKEGEKVEAKITDLVKQLGDGWRVEFQGDPRGNTVKLFYADRWVNVND